MGGRAAGKINQGKNLVLSEKKAREMYTRNGGGGAGGGRVGKMNQENKTVCANNREEGHGGVRKCGSGRAGNIPGNKN